MTKHTKIMVVDGSEVSRTIITRILNAEISNCDVTPCMTAAQALGHLDQNEKYDIITTALMLPDMDGLDLCRQIRTNQTHHYTPVIVVSGDAHDRLLREGFQAGVTDYFDKSHGYKAFGEFLKSFLKHHTGLTGKVLYVEDSPTAAAIAKRILKKHGLKLVHVTTAEEALAKLEENLYTPGSGSGFDIIVTDFFLKDKLTGGDLLHAIRTRYHLSRQEMPVLVMTVNDNQKIQAEIFHAGANDFINKPLFEEILIARIRSLLLIKQQYEAIKKQAEEMSRLATTDSLTGVRSRRYLLEKGEPYLAVIDNRPVSVLIMDIDHFKDVNDQHGHLSGDHVLASMGELLNDMFDDGIVIRFGGEEFAILIPRCRATAACDRAEELRQAVAQLRPADIDITASIGLVSSHDHPRESLTHLLAMADKALYQAKESGRNRVYIYTNDGPQDMQEAV